MYITEYQIRKWKLFPFYNLSFYTSTTRNINCKFDEWNKYE